MPPEKLLNNCKNIALTNDGVVNIVKLNLAAAVLANENLIADLNFHLYLVAVNNAAGADFDYFINFGLFLCGCGEENAERFEIIKQEVGNIFAKSIEDSIPGVQDAHAYDVKVFINDRKNN